MKAFKVFTICCLCLAFVLAATPSWAKVKDFDFPTLSKIEIPNPDKVVLDNGMALYLLEDHELPRINIAATINKCGGYLEPPNKIGLASMTGTVMRTGGTTSMTGDQIDEELEAIGAFVETGIGTTSGSARANALSDYSERIIQILADVLRNPVFNEDKIELARTEAKSAISRRNDDPMPLCIAEYRKLIYGPDSPYARQEEYATVDAITRDDMVMFHKMVVQPNNVQMAIIGDFNKDEMIAMLKKYFADWPRGTMEIPAPPDVDYDFKPTVNYTEKTDVNQSNILMGHIGGKMGDPDYPATIVMNSILGGSFGSRLTDNVRSKKGLAYGASGRFSFNYDYPGFFYAYAGTKSESTVAAMKEMIKQIKSMQVDIPTETEMTKAKDGWLNSFVFNFDSKGKVLGRMMTYDYYGMDRDYLQQLKEAVENVTPQDVIDVAKRKLHPDALQMLVVGNAADFDEPLSTFGEVNDIDITIPSPEVEEFAATDEELAMGHEMLVKAAEVCGGVSAFKKIKNVTNESKVTINTPQGAMTLDVESVDVLPNKSAQVVSTPMGKQTMVFDGESGWISMAGQTKMYSADQIKENNEEIARNLYLLFAYADQKDYVMVANKGTEEFNGMQAERLDFLTKDGTQFTMYFNPEDNMPMGMKYMGETMAGPGENVVVYKEFKEFNGVKVPVKMTRTGGGMDLDVEVTGVTINGDYDASLFEKPEGM